MLFKEVLNLDSRALLRMTARQEENEEGLRVRFFGKIRKRILESKYGFCGFFFSVDEIQK